MINTSFEQLFAPNNNVAIEEVTDGFFTEDNPYGYTNYESFNKQIQILSNPPKGHSKWQLIHLNNLFQNFKMGKKLTREPQISCDNGVEYIWCSFSYGNIKQNLKIQNFDKIFDFIKDYSMGSIKVNYTLEDLWMRAAKPN